MLDPNYTRLVLILLQIVVQLVGLGQPWLIVNLLIVLPGKTIQTYSMYKHRVYRNGQYRVQEPIELKLMVHKVEMEVVVQRVD